MGRRRARGVQDVIVGGVFVEIYNLSSRGVAPGADGNVRASERRLCVPCTSWQLVRIARQVAIGHGRQTRKTSGDSVLSVLVLG